MLHGVLSFVCLEVLFLKCPGICEQTNIMATDKIGLELLKKVGALDCHNNWMDNKRCVESPKRQVLKNMHLQQSAFTAAAACRTLHVREWQRPQ